MSAGDITQGYRVYLGRDERAPIEHLGAYWRDPANPLEWYAVSPTGLLAALRGHTVTQHDDGSITVSPSIAVRQGVEADSPAWHGFLERGIWREV